MTNLVDGYPHEIGSRAAFKGKSVVFIKVKSTILRVIRMRQGRRAKWILASLLLAGPLVTPPPKDFYSLRNVLKCIECNPS